MRTKKDFAKQNEYNKANYDHFNLMLPKGKKAILQNIAQNESISLNALINNAIDFYLNSNNIEEIYIFDMNNFNNMFYGNIIALCVRKNLTINKLTEILSIPTKEMKNIQLNGNCSETTINKIANYFEKTPTEIMMGTIFMELPENMWRYIK